MRQAFTESATDVVKGKLKGYGIMGIIVLLILIPVFISQFL